MTYSFIALSDNLKGGRKSVDVNIDEQSIRFDLEDVTYNWLIGDLEIELGGSANSLIYFKNKLEPSVVLYTREKAILKNPIIAQHPQLANSSKKIRGSFNKRKGLYAVVLAVIVLIPISFYAFRTPIIRGVADKVPIEWEVEAGDKLFETLKIQYDIKEDSLISAKFDSIFKPLVDAANTPEIEYKFYLCSDPTLNAFALPGGHIVINSGTIDKIERIEELYGVIGHEIGHVTQRHHIRGIIGNLSTFLIFQGLIGDEAGIIGALGESAGHLESLFYSRNFERESDQVGFDYLVKAEIDPNGMVEFFQRIKAEYEDDIDEVTDLIEGDEEVEGDDDLEESDSTSTDTWDKIESFASTHPGVEERIAYLQNRVIKEEVSFESKDFDLIAFQNFIKTKLE